MCHQDFYDLDFALCLLIVNFLLQSELLMKKYIYLHP